MVSRFRRTLSRISRYRPVRRYLGGIRRRVGRAMMRYGARVARNSRYSTL